MTSIKSVFSRARDYHRWHLIPHLSFYYPCSHYYSKTSCSERDAKVSKSTKILQLLLIFLVVMSLACNFAFSLTDPTPTPSPTQAPPTDTPIPLPPTLPPPPTAAPTAAGAPPAQATEAQSPPGGAWTPGA